MLDTTRIIWEKLGLDPSRLGAGRVYRFSALGTPLVAGATSNPVTIRWRKTGVLWGMSGQPQSGALVDYAGLEFRFQYQGQEELITDGDNGTYAPMLAMFSPQTPIWVLNPPRLVHEGNNVSVYFRNTTAATTIVPTLLLHQVELR